MFRIPAACIRAGIDSRRPAGQCHSRAGKALWFLSGIVLPEALSRSETFRELGCSAFVPLNYEGSLIGFMALGSRRSGDPYTGDDLDFLGTVAGQSALALENARLFINLRHTLDQTLEMKNLMDDIFASIATGVITTDVGHKVTLFNRAAENILGIAVKDVLGKSLPEALPLFPDLETAATEAVDRGTATLSQEVTPNMPPVVTCICAFPVRRCGMLILAPRVLPSFLRT